ncbi:MAG: hypothetical protein IJA60_05155 [Clostridia bacterium]|nr:hypothetical protein [Clostridia bacterium]
MTGFDDLQGLALQALFKSLAAFSAEPNQASFAQAKKHPLGAFLHV